MLNASKSKDHLPLQPHVFHILLSLVGRKMHGYRIIKDIGERTQGELLLGTSTLYAAIKRMVAAGLLEETSPPADADSADVRRRYYRATPLGREVAREEAHRIRRLDAMVARTDLLEGSAPEPGGE